LQNTSPHKKLLSDLKKTTVFPVKKLSASFESNHIFRLLPRFLIHAALLICASIFLHGNACAGDESVFAKDNLLAWCIVPFDAANRGPEERAEMLRSLGIRRLAYDYRPQHIPTWDRELTALKQQGIELTAWWFPGAMNQEAIDTLELFRRHAVQPQLWVMGAPDVPPDAAALEARLVAETARLSAIAQAAKPLGCRVALYNHGGWFGEPDNQLEIIRRLTAAGIDNVGIVYNLHHGHPHLANFSALLARMKPHLFALNLNGMRKGAESGADKFMPIGQGESDLEILRAIRDTGWKGPVGILNHTNVDARLRLMDNIEGLEWLVRQLDGKPAGPKPMPRSWKSADGTPVSARESVIPAARPEELTRTNGWPAPEHFRNWQRSLGGPTSNRYSALTTIDKSNVAKLEAAWTWRSGEPGNVQCNPIVVDGVMYAPSGGGSIAAVDAASGKELWRYRPQEQTPRLQDTVARRGLLYWPGDEVNPPRLIFGAGDWILALDPRTGKPLDSFGQGGRTRIPAGTTAVGAVFRHMLVVPGFLEDIFGYDIRDGKLLWTFVTKPGPGQEGGETWSRVEHGANCWGGMALDESRGIAYFGLGSPKPNFQGMGRRGDNLFSNCVVALDALTGKRLWHFQEARHDIWDWDIPAPPNLVTVERDGIKVDAVAQVTKIGNTLLLDRVTGRPLYEVPLRRVDTKGLLGEVPSPVQPFPELPRPFSRSSFTEADITKIDPAATAAVSLVFAQSNHGPYPSIEEAKPTLMFNIHGGAQWTGAAATPAGHLFVTANEIPWKITMFRDDDPEPKDPPNQGEQMYLALCSACHGPERGGIGHAPPLRGLRHRLDKKGLMEIIQKGRGSMPAMPGLTSEMTDPLADFLLCLDRPAAPAQTDAPPIWNFQGWNKLQDPQGYPGCTPPWGTLNCIDLNTGLIRWQVPLGEYSELTKRGIPKTGQENFGGASVTASGLVFVSGTADKLIRAFDAETGAELWSRPLPWHGTAPPTIYESGGRQFVVVPATGGGKLGGEVGDAYVAFALPQ
jgi:quinoprotein glucose dehydrogenase